jgi:hypothetical protein
MKRKLLTIAVTALLAGMAGYTAEVVAAKGSPGPPPGKGKGGGGETTAGNNLSYPAVLFTGSNVTPFFEVEEGTFGVTYSYGCGTPETVGKFEYPNTSCVSGWNADGTAVSFLTAAQCTGTDTSWTGATPCLDSTVDRIYWQKETLNKWSAEATVLTPPAVVRFVDWGDSIESVTWSSTSILRVETQLYLDLGQDTRTEIPADAGAASGTQLGFQMWHSQGQGTTEQWGVRVSEKEGSSTPEPKVIDKWYGYLGPYAIINAGTAELLLTKLEPGSRGCPTDPYAGRSNLFPNVGWIAGSGWDTGCTLAPVPYTVELSVTGKYVHGYNWRMSSLSDPLPAAYCGDATWKKAGWWRLTFLPNIDGGTKVQFPDDEYGVAVIAPTAPEATPEPVVLAAAADEGGDDGGETESGPLYQPFVDIANQLTYIDICVSEGTRGGGGKGGRQ